MVQIDNKIKEVISEIKAEERKIADRELAIIKFCPSSFCGYLNNATSLKLRISAGIPCTQFKSKL
tara:strand:- start:617 stop:811 length:195 start_codon:yes stop_codon:yes gene_type:complete